MAQHNFTIEGKATVAEYLPTITEQEAQTARDNGNDSTIHFGKISHVSSDIKTLVLTCVNFLPNVYTANIPPNWTSKEVFTDGTIKDLPSQSKGITVAEFTTFWNMITPFSFGETVSKNLTNLMINATFGSAKDSYTVHCFTEDTLQGYQPILFNVTQDTQTETGGNISVNVTDGSTGYEYSLDGSTWQSESTFNDVAAGQITVYVRDSASVQNSRTFNVVTNSI